MLHQSQRIALIEFRRDVFGVRLVAFKFCVARVGNKCALQRGIDRLVICYLIVDVGLVEGLAVELGDFGALICRLLAQRLASVVIFRGDSELFHQRQRFSFTAL